MVEVMKIMVTSFRRSHARTVHSVPPALQQDIINPRLRRRLLDTRTSLGQSLAGSLLLSPFIFRNCELNVEQMSGKVFFRAHLRTFHLHLYLVIKQSSWVPD